MTLSRRDFLRSLSYGTLSTTAFITSAAQFSLVNALAATGAPADYKALVGLFLLGGNDANNMIIPLDSYAEYAAVRGSLAIPQGLLLPITPPSAGQTFGFHPSLSKIHDLWQHGKVAIVTNVGPLIEPLARDDFLSRSRSIPHQLFSHTDQQCAWQSAYASGPLSSGWGGRLADRLPAEVTDGFSSVAVTNITLFNTGETTFPLVLPPAPTPLNHALVLKRAGDVAADSALRTLLNLASTPATPDLMRTAARVHSNAIATSLLLDTDPVISTSFPATPLGNTLKQIAKLIQFSMTLGIRRQIFFCTLGGFDTHANQGTVAGTQATLLQTMSDALSAFYNATVVLGVAADVTTFTMSDFNRTLKPAGTGAAVGTDHAWGSHHLVLGDAVADGDFYGPYPTLALNGPDDAETGTGARGRWIPTTSVEQYAATLATWFGVSQTDLMEVFPNLSHFDTANLGFLS